MLRPFLRRLLEAVYDGKPEAAQEVAAAAARVKTQAKARRDRLTVPGGPAVLASLASTYRNPGVGTVTISDRGGTKWLNAGFVRTLTIRDTQRRRAACQGPTHVHVRQLGDCAR